MRNFISGIDLGSAPVLKQDADHPTRLVRVSGYPLDTMNKADGLDLLRSTPNEYAKLVIFDPQYRQVLDQLKFGNEGKRQKGRALLPQQSNDEICQFGAEIVRVLKPGGYVMLWCDKFIVCQGLALNFFQDKLKLVDLLTWDKGKIGMGKRTRRRCEHAMFFQKAPHVIRAKQLVTWKTMPCIADVWSEPIKNKVHPHQKPFGLQKAVIEATTEPGDVVIDPVAGSFSVMRAAHACGRRFLGGDILGAVSKQILKGEADSLGLGTGSMGPSGSALHLTPRRTSWHHWDVILRRTGIAQCGAGDRPAAFKMSRTMASSLE